MSLDQKLTKIEEEIKVLDEMYTDNFNLLIDTELEDTDILVGEISGELKNSKENFLFLKAEVIRIQDVLAQEESEEVLVSDVHVSLQKRIDAVEYQLNLTFSELKKLAQSIEKLQANAKLSAFKDKLKNEE